MKKSSNRRKGIQREGNLIDRLWNYGYVLIHAPRSAGGYPKRLFREKYSDIFKANKNRPVKPVDFVAMRRGKSYLCQVSRHRHNISGWEIHVLVDLAQAAGATPILGWIDGGRWKFIEADTKNEIDLLNSKTKYERFIEGEGMIP